MKRTVAALALILVACKETSPTAATTVGGPGAAYVSAMMAVMQTNSIHRKTIDWTSFRSQVFAAVPPGGSIADSYTAIYLALELLGDNHSQYRALNGLILYASTLDCTAPTIPAVAPLGADIGYVRVGGVSAGGGTPGGQVITDSIQSIIRAADNAQIRGWIVDLRGNPGGSVPPMLAGVGPILGIGTAGYYVDANGIASPWGYDGRNFEVSGVVEQPVSSPYTLLSPSPRVAVLLDRRVESAGEATAIAFKLRPNTRFFGTGTCGLSTANAAYLLSDGATLVLTVGIDADRTGTQYGGPVLPDSVITDTSAVVPAAVAWLRSQHP